VLLHLRPQRQRLAVLVRHELRHVGRRRWRRRSQQVLEHPLAAKNDRRAIGIRRHGQDAALAEQAAPVRIAQRHAAELRSIDTRDAVVLCEALVDERMVGRQQVEQTAIFADDAADEELRFFHEGRAKRLVEREDDRIGRRRFDVAQVQPLAGKV